MIFQFRKQVNTRIRWALILFAATIVTAQTEQPSWQPEIPRTWVDNEIRELELPPAGGTVTPKYILAEFYYGMTERVVYKSYPVYAPGKGPTGYIESLKKLKPGIAFDAKLLKTREDWIRAGELAFEAPIQASPVPDDPAILEQIQRAMSTLRQSRDGVIPGISYIIREEGKVELGTFSCAMCHSRVMPDGTVIKGAQGNQPFDPPIGKSLLGAPDEIARQGQMALFGVPWDAKAGPQVRAATMTAKQLGEAHMAIPDGVIARHGSSVFSPVQVPDLIGVQDRKYLDRTGLQRHRSIVDLMRYGALNQGADMYTSFDGFMPGGREFKTLPNPANVRRYSDEQLYALSLYLYSLKPPSNPNQPSELTQRGQQVFHREGCGGCHTPPLYTNNKLTPAEGFQVPDSHRTTYDVMPISVGTDPTLTLHTRRGTGYYKVPSLKGVWYRGPFEHNGSVATLEDWFDPARLREDYVPTGFKGYGLKTRAVKGHEFGLKLSPEDKQALIAFLKTL